MAQRRGFGSVRKLPSGRWQARFTHPRTGKIHSAQSTFDSKAGAGRWIATMETDADPTKRRSRSIVTVPPSASKPGGCDQNVLTDASVSCPYPAGRMLLGAPDVRGARSPLSCLRRFGVVPYLV